MATMNLSTPAEVAESALDGLLADLLNGEPDAATRWLADAPGLMESAPGYDAGYAITHIILSAREEGEMTAA